MEAQTASFDCRRTDPHIYTNYYKKNPLAIQEGTDKKRNDRNYKAKSRGQKVPAKNEKTSYFTRKRKEPLPVEEAPSCLVFFGLDLGGLAGSAAHIIELCATHTTLAHKFDLLDLG